MTPHETSTKRYGRVRRGIFGFRYRMRNRRVIVGHTTDGKAICCLLKTLEWDATGAKHVRETRLSLSLEAAAALSDGIRRTIAEVRR